MSEGKLIEKIRSKNSAYLNENDVVVIDWEDLKTILGEVKKEFPVRTDRVAPPDLLNVYAEHKAMFDWFIEFFGDKNE